MFLMSFLLLSFSAFCLPNTDEILEQIKIEEPNLDFGDKLHIVATQKDERFPNDIIYMCLTTDSDDEPLYFLSYDSNRGSIALIE